MTILVTLVSLMRSMLLLRQNSQPRHRLKHKNSQIKNIIKKKITMVRKMDLETLMTLMIVQSNR